MPSDNHLHILIMAGGSGTRFWPKSRQAKPKQLLALWDDRTLLEHTVDRFQTKVALDQIWIVTTQALVAASREVLGERANKIHFLGEPAAKNTAACIYWGIREIRARDPKAVIAVMPADHFIGDERAFLKAVDVAVAAARAEASIVTLGIRPSKPETGYGYIETSGNVDSGVAQAVSKFVEKPNFETAVQYLKTGRYLWNAGMFIFLADVGVQAYQKTMPRLCEIFDAHREIGAVYGAIDKPLAVSVDYGVMEPALTKGVRVSVVPADCGWNDVGSFTALEEIDRAVLGEVACVDAKGNVVQSDRGVVALLGVQDLVVVRDGDVVMVCAKNRAQDVKVLLEQVKSRRPELA